MNRIKRMSVQLLERYSDMFTDDFEKNKEILNKVAVIRSKGLRNELAGYITVYMKGQTNSKEEADEIETESSKS
ncbi:MAG: 30S ribosomal protein S17e [Nitrososphaerales archaeon]